MWAREDSSVPRGACRPLGTRPAPPGILFFDSSQGHLLHKAFSMALMCQRQDRHLPSARRDPGASGQVSSAHCSHIPPAFGLAAPHVLLSF